MASPATGEAAKTAGGHITTALDSAFQLLMEAHKPPVDDTVNERIRQLQDTQATLLAICTDLAGKESVRRKIAGRNLGKRVVLRLTKGGLMMGWRSFQQNVVARRKKRFIADKAVRAMCHRPQARAFATWRAAHVEATKTRQMSENEGLRAVVAANQSKIEALELQLAAEQQVRHAEFAKVELVLRQLEVLYQASEGGEARKRQAAIDRQLRRVLHRMRNTTLTLGFAAWREAFDRRKAMTIKHKRALNMMRNKPLTLAFLAWGADMRVMHKASVHNKMRSKLERIEALEMQVREVPAALESRVHSTMAQIEQRATDQAEAMLEQVLGRDEAQHRARVQRYVRTALVRIKMTLVAEAFAGFCEFKARQRRRFESTRRAVNMFIRRQLTLAFSEWRALWRHGRKSGPTLAAVGLAERMTVLEGDLESGAFPANR